MMVCEICGFHVYDELDSEDAIKEMVRHFFKSHYAIYVSGEIEEYVQWW